MADQEGDGEEIKHAGSYGLAVQLADEWEQEVRHYKKTHKKAVTDLLESMIDQAAVRAGAPINGIWNHRDVARKACEILKERFGE